MGEHLHLCATTRLAQALRGAIPAGRTHWRAPLALTVGQWLATLAEEAQLCAIADLPDGLDPYAERLLWERVIGDALAAAPLFDLPGLAAAAAEAHAVSRLWALPPAGPQASEEARRFAAWQSDFQRRCRSAGWSDPASLQLRVVELIAAGHFGLPARVSFAGFDRLTPFERRLWETLAARGVAVDELPPGPAAGDVEVLACADPEAECAAAVAWAQARLAADPGCRLAIVAPDLAGVRDRLAFRLDDALHPEAIRPAAGEAPRAFNVSLGRPLAEAPPVGSGLELLAMVGSRGKCEQARLSALLLGMGWAGDVGEADGRARLDREMRGELPFLTSLPALLRFAERLAEQRGFAYCPRSLAALAGALALAREAPRQARPGEWATHFAAFLRAAGWPGERPLSSDEFQAQRAFAELLAGFGRFDAQLGRIGQGEALRHLRELCRLRLFQPETRGRPAIQVLGVLESAGLVCDGIWVLGLNDERWPPAPRPNPLLPLELQRRLATPHASAEVELDFARRVQQRLLCSAPEIRLSWARADGSRPLRPSPLLAGWPQREMPALADTRLAARQVGSARLQEIDDALAPPLAPGEKVAGGSWLLRAQAICPAWAYYQFRLGAEALEAPVEGLDPRARGTLVHAALEAFWRATGDSASFAGLGAAGREAAIAGAVEQALAQFAADRRSEWPARFRQLEAARLQRLLAVWLEIEAARPVDFTVVALEEKHQLEIEGIAVSLVVDRIDRLSNGRQAIIDYKTGASLDPGNWAADRLSEPQLPIYAALLGDDVAAVAFARVRPDRPGFVGIAAERDLLPGVGGLGDTRQKAFTSERFPSWEALLTHWQSSLHAIAREVREGVAAVAIADESALAYCPVLPLLRLPERRRWLNRAAETAR